MRLSLRQAAEAVGRSRSGVFHAIKSGRLRGYKNAGGLIEIEAADLYEMFPSEKTATALRGRPPLKFSETDKPLNLGESAMAAVMAEENKQLRSAKEKDLYDRIIKSEAENAKLKAAIQAAEEKSVLFFNELREVNIRREAEQARMRQTEHNLAETKAQFEKILHEKNLQISRLSQENDHLREQMENLKQSKREAADGKKTGFLQKLFT